MKEQNKTFSYAAEGSMSVEAAIVLPIFLFFFVQLYAIFGIYIFENAIEHALHQAASEVAMYGYLIDEEQGERTRDVGNEEILEQLGDFAWSELWLRHKVEGCLEDEQISYWLVEGGKEGIDYHESSLMANENQEVVLVASYTIRPLFFADVIGHIPIRNVCVQKLWVGYQGNAFKESRNEVQVFVAENGMVYHRNRYCSYLHLSIQRVKREKLGGMRNQNGEKYYACEICGGGIGEYCFVTDDGNRYHDTLLCGALKRTVFEIPFSQVGNRECCSRCGG